MAARSLASVLELWYRLSLKVPGGFFRTGSNDLVENWHRPLKWALKTRRTEKWTEVLPTILQGFRAAIKADSKVSPNQVFKISELVYGTTLRQPGDYFYEHSVIKSPQEVVKTLIDMFHNFTSVPTKSHHIVKPFVGQGLKTCTHAFVTRDGVRKGLQLPYDGPYAVVKRDDKLYKVNIKGKFVNISIDRLKPAFPAAVSDIRIPSGKDNGRSHINCHIRRNLGELFASQLDFSCM
ncbi:hypothetical protein AVEN_202822-1 [Araneus ventricosus]|uniref:Integrase catalytic domain-containing protein n=1 Tax=Araneus ventricosus TaxID=182803 RepID=A0A4Y2DN97_ARAVE|nr:hypothetical protein AVEN_202822-1 [Araneus ventricosus]